MRAIFLAVSLLSCAVVHGQQAEDFCVVPTDRGCVGPICGLHPRAVEDRDHALILEQSLTAENYAENVKILKEDAETRDRLPSEFDMVVVGAERQKRAYELKLRYEEQRTEAARQEFCGWLHAEGYFPE